MPKRKRNNLNRGRFQAQGNGLEKSRSWAQIEIPTKSDGYAFLDELQEQLTPAEFGIRKTCFEKANIWVNKAPQRGYVIVTTMKPTFKPYPPIKDARVDGELYRGVAFKDDDMK